MVIIILAPINVANSIRTNIIYINTMQHDQSALSKKYQRKTLREQILLRPDTYIGACTVQTRSVWTPSGPLKLAFPPGLYKIIDEILVNALDNKRRDDSMRRIDISYNNGRICIANDGATVPIVKHEQHDMYIPTLVFGHLLTSDNYNDDEERVTGGRNGYGAKLTNIYSIEFQVECIDSKARKKFSQTWQNNMLDTSGPVVRACSNKKDRTTVSFTPDWVRFGLEGAPAVLETLLRRRALDIAGTSPNTLAVYFNGAKLPVKHFGAYAKQFLPNAVHIPLGDRWEVCVAAKTDDTPPVPTFVNGICTHRGGSHVKHVTGPLFQYLAEVAAKRVRGLKIKPSHVENFANVFVNCLVVNPAFDSQTKETLTSKVRDFGSRAQWTPDLLKKCARQTNILAALEEWALRRNGHALTKAVGSARTKLVIPKLHDASKAGGVHSDKCSLILTEGDSALALAVAGFSVVGRKFFGAFPLKGKLLNVRDASAGQVLQNKEIQNIMKIIGLQPGANNPRLRYGQVIIMCDQDDDGSHIGGLILNFIDHFWPGLMDGALRVSIFRTPLVKVGTQEFYSMPEYEAWSATAEPHKAKYYKGLGTSTSADAKKYFSNLATHLIPLACEEAGRDALELAFRRSKASERRAWSAHPSPEAGLVVPRSVHDFIHKQMILYVNSSIKRAICALGTDGLKPSQRKVLYTALSKNIVTDAKVAQFGAAAAEFTDYHHGEQSLHATIIKMCQTFVGSNNKNILVPKGQLGTRLMGGKDAASPRYVFTHLSEDARVLFPKADDTLLRRVVSDGHVVEPETYAPIVPMGLVNGSKGLATGWSAWIPPHAFKDVVNALMARLNNVAAHPITPSWNNFTGRVQVIGNKVKTCGVWNRVGPDKIRITELPVGVWTQPYKEWLEQKCRRVEDHSTDERVDLYVWTDVSDADIVSYFKLEKSDTMLWVGFDTTGQLKRYAGAEQVLDEFVPWRLAIYERRLQKEILEAEQEVIALRRKETFLNAVVSNQIVLSADIGHVEHAIRALGLEGPFDDLLDLPLRSLSSTRLAQTRNRLQRALNALEIARGRDARDVWKEELRYCTSKKRTRTT